MLRTTGTIAILAIAFGSLPGLAETWDCGTSTGYSDSFKLDTGVSDCTGWTVPSGDFVLDTIWSPSSMKKHQPGQTVTLPDLPITRIFADRFYIEALDRGSGIGALESLTDPLAEPGRLATVTGTLSDVEGEVMLAPPELAVSLGGLGDLLEPFLLTSRELGGGPEGFQRGITGASSLNNIGLLITTTGRVTYANTDYFYIDDGSEADDGSGHPGVKVFATGLSIPAEDSYVKVTGISSCFADDPDLHRLIRVQDEAGIVVLQ